MINETLIKLFKTNKEQKKSDFPDILGQDNVKYALKSALISKRHVIIVGPPGVGKTTLVKNLAENLPEITVNDCGFNCNPNSPICPRCKKQNRNSQDDNKITTKNISGKNRFVRIQGSPDLTVEDIMGDIDPLNAVKFGPSSVEAFTPGKIFRANNGILFFDEINRCPEKLQNALLQVLEEGIATIGSYKIDIPTDFILIATMNPKDTNTEKLSDVLLDRFDMIDMSYPENIETEKKIVIKKGKNFDITFDDNLVGFLVDFVRNFRLNKNLETIPSVRASIGLYERSQANAILNDRDEVKFNDIQDSMTSVLSHRIKLKPSSKYLTSPKDLIRHEMENFVENNSKYKQLSKDSAKETERESGDSP